MGTASALRRRFYAARDRAALEPIRFHDLRHTFGTIAVQAFPLTDVEAFMGHADIQTTMIYIHHVPQRDAAEKLSRRVELRTQERESGARWVHGGTQEGYPENAELPLSRVSRCRRQDSNLRHADYDSAALTTELLRRGSRIVAAGGCAHPA